MALPLISVIIPVYDVEPYIEGCLRSVISQTYSGAIECIIVDDCGQDQSISIAESIIRDYHGSITFKIIHHACNRGLSAARNTGLDNASGEYVFFLDSDDELTPRCIELLSDGLRDRKYDIVVGDYEVVGNVESLGLKKCRNDVITDRKECLRAFMNGDIYVMAWNKLISKDFLIDNKLYFKEGLIYEDMLWSFYMSFCVSSVKLVREITYKYKRRPYSITSDMDEAKFKHQIRVFAEKVEFADSRRLYSRFPEIKGHLLREMSGLIQSNLSHNFQLDNINQVRKRIKLRHILCFNLTPKVWGFAVVLAFSPLPLVPHLFRLKNFISHHLLHRPAPHN